jgi:hydroxymethylpyrimidine pyrophosphatase-like HAD family hydrolase
MNTLNTFNGRYAYGEEAEIAFENYLKNKSITYIRYINESYWNKTYDLINGDFFVMNENFDVKRNSISFHSLDNFKGKYYIIYHHDLHSSLVIETNEIQKLNRNNYDILSSGDKGFKYYRLKNLKHVTLDEFFKS